MDNNQHNVPFIVHESIVASMERTIKRLWILCVVMFLSLVISVGGDCGEAESNENGSNN